MPLISPTAHWSSPHPIATWSYTPPSYTELLMPFESSPYPPCKLRDVGTAIWENGAAK